MPFSIHSKRWLEGMLNLPLEVHFYSSFPYAKSILPTDGIIYHDYLDNRYQIRSKIFLPIDSQSFEFLNSIKVLKYLGMLKRKLGLSKNHAYYLARAIQNINPDFVHTLETQHAGYLLNEALQSYQLKKTFTWIHSTWGIDIHHFEQFEEHGLKLKEIFQNIDIYCSEGNRDLQLAKKLGFTKRTFVFPSVGGYYEIPDFATLPSKRDIILLKGYENEIRKGLNGLKGILYSKLAQKFKIVIYGASQPVLDFVDSYTGSYHIEIKSGLSHHEMIDLTQNAIISMTINLSDGLPNSFIEAMGCGAFPIQSNTSMADEWIVNEKTGVLVEPANIDEITQAVDFALSDKDLIDDAALKNRMVFLKSFNKERILRNLKNLYRVN